jgi:hypothetical protein
VQKFDEFKELGSEAAVKVRTDIVWLRDDILGKCKGDVVLS